MNISRHIIFDCHVLSNLSFILCYFIVLSFSSAMGRVELQSEMKDQLLPVLNKCCAMPMQWYSVVLIVAESYNSQNYFDMYAG